MCGCTDVGYSILVATVKEVCIVKEVCVCVVTVKEVCVCVCMRNCDCLCVCVCVCVCVYSLLKSTTGYVRGRG